MRFEYPYLLTLLLIPFGCVFQVWRRKPPGRRVIPLDLSAGDPSLGVVVNLGCTAVLIALGAAVVWLAKPQFSFTYPWLLPLLAAPLALLVWTWLREGGRVALPFDYGKG